MSLVSTSAFDSSDGSSVGAAQKSRFMMATNAK